MQIDHPEGFFRILHPANRTSSGQIVLSRKIGANRHQSRVPPTQLEKIAKQAVGLNDIFFSTASFLGRPLALNFNNANCLHLQVPATDTLTYMRLTQSLGRKHIPLPTTALSDGETITLLWILDKPIPAHEFYIYSLLQRCIYAAAEEFYPSDENLNIAFLTRLVGSKNSMSRENVRIPHYSGRIYRRAHIEEVVFQAQTSIKEYQYLQTHAGIILELLALLSDRWWTNHQYPEVFQDWLIFFCASLCHFCTRNQLEQELKAVAESLEAKPWAAITNAYSAFIKSIAETVADGYIEDNGTSISIKRWDWTTLICGKLDITDTEINTLGLQVLAGTSNVSPHLHAQARHIYPVGSEEFIPYERLLFREAS